MRTIRRTGTYKRDYKREKNGRHRKTIDNDLLNIVAMLANDEPLAERHHDHPLVGEWRDHRDGHIKPDPVLIYRKTDANTLDLIRLASHS